VLPLVFPSPPAPFCLTHTERGIERKKKYRHEINRNMTMGYALSRRKEEEEGKSRKMEER